MKNESRWVEDKGSIGLYSGVNPSLGGFPFHEKHPIGENSAEAESGFVGKFGFFLFFRKGKNPDFHDATSRKGRERAFFIRYCV